MELYEVCQLCEEIQELNRCEECPLTNCCIAEIREQDFEDMREVADYVVYDGERIIGKLYNYILGVKEGK